jgi:two-component system sensor histidine kinase KdpD
MADALDAQWIVVYVETPELLRLSESERNRRIAVLRLAESLGGESVTLDGPSAAATIAEYARVRHATRVIVGTPKRRGWRAWLRPSTAIELTRRARDFDVMLIGAARPPAPPAAHLHVTAAAGGPAVHWDRYAWAAAITVLCTLLAFAIYPHFELSNLVMIYLLGVTVAGLRLGRGPSALTALLNVAAFDFFFVPPRYSFAVSDVQYLVTFGAMVTIALVIATLTASVRQQTRVAGARERRTSLLYAMSRELAATRGIANMARVAVRHVAEVFECQAVVLLPATDGKLRYPAEPPLESSFRRADLAVAQWVADHGRRAGLGSDTLPAAPGLYVPLGEEGRTVGVLAVLPSNPRRVLLPEQSLLLGTFAGQIALALERARLAEVAEQSSLAAERETLRNTLLASISHDLRTPLAVIAGAGSTLAQHGSGLDEATRVQLARSVETKAREMSELVSNVLDLVRFESGQAALRRDWQTLDDLVGSALASCADRLAAHPVELRLGADLPPVWVDATLIVQVFANLFDNVAKYTPPGTRVVVSAVAEPDRDFVRVTLDDEGPGLPAGDPARLFDKFQRGSGEGTVAGVGLGLAICQAIVRAHGGEIEAQRREGGGARFVFTLPATEAAAA